MPIFVLYQFSAMELYTCYDHVIGLSDTDCECIATDRPVDYNVSNSGLYLGELTPISGLIADAKCNKSVWDAATKAVERATKQFVADTNALLGNRFRLKRKIVSKQLLGEIKKKDTVSPSKNYAVVTLYCAPVRGGFMRLRRLGGIFAGAAPVSVELYDNVTGLLGTYEITTVANRHTDIEVGIDLPLWTNKVPYLEYYLVYQFDEDNLPKETEINCGCGGWTPSYNTDSPYFLNVGGHRRAPWADYVMVGGREINSLTELDDDTKVMRNDVYGLTLEVDFSCRVDEVLCEDALDFTGNPLALSMALAIQHKAGVILADSVLKNTDLNRETMINSDEWEESVLEWQAKYNEYVNYIAAEADHTANDCLACKEIIGLTRRGLFS